MYHPYLSSCGPCSLRNEQDSCVEYIKERSDKPTCVYPWKATGALR